MACHTCHLHDKEDIENCSACGTVKVCPGCGVGGRCKACVSKAAKKAGPVESVEDKGAVGVDGRFKDTPIRSAPLWYLHTQMNNTHLSQEVRDRLWGEVKRRRDKK